MTSTCQVCKLICAKYLTVPIIHTRLKLYLGQVAQKEPAEDFLRTICYIIPRIVTIFNQASTLKGKLENPWLIKKTKEEI